MPDISKSDFYLVQQLLTAYLVALHKGDTRTLEEIFHSDTVLKAPGLRRTRTEWLNLVASRPIPEAEGEIFSGQILALDIVKDQAMAKLKVPLFDHDYIDFIGLLKENGQWRIVSKNYCDLAV